MIVVAGESLIDMVPTGNGSFRAVPGGGPFNVARTIARLGEPCAYLGSLSTDGFGQLLRRTWSNRTSTTHRHRRPIRRRHSPSPGSTSPGQRLTCSTSTERPRRTDRRAGPGSGHGLGAEDPVRRNAGLVLEPMASSVETAVDSLPDDVLLVVDPNWPTILRAHPGARRRLDRISAAPTSSR